MDMRHSVARRSRWVRHWDRSAAGYDGSMRFLDRTLFRDTRAWVCARARGEVLEVAVGTGLNLAHYPPDARLTGIDISPAMLALARDRSVALGREIALGVGDAEALDFADGSFDTVVCTFSLCAIPDERRAVTEMVRVLRPGGLLLLGDHVASGNVAVRAVQRLTEVVSVPVAGEHFCRRPADLLAAAGLVVAQRERFALGMVERLAAGRPVLDDAARRPGPAGTVSR